MTDDLVATARQLAQSGRLPEAAVCYERILAGDPRNAEALGTVARLRHAQWNLDGAIEAFRQLVTVQPLNPAAWHDLGSALFDRGMADESVAAIRVAVRLRPDLAQLHMSLACALISLGQFEEGWRELEWRLAVPEWGLSRGFAQPQWNGSNIHGRSLLIHNEGGMGDAIQFVRYVPLLEKYGAELILECPQELIRLFSQIPGIEQIIARGTSLPGFDFHVPSITIPGIVGTTLQTVPADVPYLHAPQPCIEFFRNRIPWGGSLKVGLVWAGNVKPQDPRSHLLSEFAPLGDIGNVKFYSLQKGPESAQKRPENLPLIDFSSDLNDLADTAGLISLLDLVISVDTSVAHLAGATGKTVWTLVPCRCDPRWLVNRADSPWYPTMRLFRQETPGDWDGVVRKVGQALEAFVAEGK